MSAGSPPRIPELSIFIGVTLILRPHDTKGREEEDGGKSQGPIVRLAWLGGSVGTGSPHSQAHRQQGLGQGETGWEMQRTNAIPELFACHGHHV